MKLPYAWEHAVTQAGSAYFIEFVVSMRHNADLSYPYSHEHMQTTWDDPVRALFGCKLISPHLGNNNQTAPAEKPASATPARKSE